MNLAVRDRVKLDLTRQCAFCGGPITKWVGRGWQDSQELQTRCECSGRREHPLCPCGSGLSVARCQGEIAPVKP